jgi:hypothetical protein
MKKEPGDRKLLAAVRTLRKVIDKHFRGEPITFEDEKKYLAHAKSLIEDAELLYNTENNNVIEPQLQQTSVSSSLAILEQMLSSEQKAYDSAQTKTERNRILQNGEHLTYVILLLKKTVANDR